MSFKAGKLPVRLLAGLLKRYARGGKGVVIGPSVGIDSAVIDVKGGFLAAKTDPITFVADDIGFYTVYINANDIAVMGGTPRWLLVTILLPEGKATEGLVKRIFSQLYRTCRDLDVALCGGHTEVTRGIDRPIVIGAMLGVVPEDRVITGAGARPGDDIILTKGIAIEAASVIARVREKELARIFPKPFIVKCKNLIKRPGLGVVKDAKAALKWGRVHAMHDPTEGGLATGLHELAIASGCGVLVDKASIPVLPEARRLCAHFGLDVMGAIASGALIISVAPEDSGRVIKGLDKAGIRAAVIGRVTRKREGVKIIEGGKLKPLRLFERDEVTRIL
ncbi:MAG: hydrogenase expression/formation protein [Deltaproteobacteria bacterium]|nr:hydrogenase expression/formation protein [Deltaproteobacteria bacterium]